MSSQLEVVAAMAKQLTDAHQQYLHMYSQLMELVGSVPVVMPSSPQEAVVAPAEVNDEEGESEVDTDTSCNKWVKHVKDYSKEHNMSYVEATKDTDCKQTYHSKIDEEDLAIPAKHSGADYEAAIPEWALDDVQVQDVISSGRFNPMEILRVLFYNSDHKENWSVCCPSVTRNRVRVRQHGIWTHESYDGWLLDFLRYVAIPLYYNNKEQKLSLFTDRNGINIETEEKCYLYVELKKGGELENDYNYYAENIRYALESFYKSSPERYS